MAIEDSIQVVSKTARNFVIGLAVFILASFVVVYGLNMIIEKPNYEDFCGGNLYEIDNAATCASAGGIWKNYSTTEKETLVRAGECSSPIKCYDDYNEANKKFRKIIFLFSVPLGVIIIVLGALIFSINSVGIGLMLAGVFTLIYGAGGYWQYGENWMRFLASLVGLIAVIFFAYWFQKKK